MSQYNNLSIEAYGNRTTVTSNASPIGLLLAITYGSTTANWNSAQLLTFGVRML